MLTKPRSAAQRHTDPSLLPLHQELQRAFDFFNKRHFEGKLTPCIFSFFPQPPNGNTLGHYQPATWDIRELSESLKAIIYPEIIFYADLCLERGVNQCLQTLLHEMVHHWQHLFGKPGTIHNAEWHAKARSCGLATKGNKGYTTPTPDFKAQLAAFNARVEGIPFRRAKLRKAGKMKKWVCSCGYGVRIGRQEFNAKCLDCGEKFELAEES